MLAQNFKTPADLGISDAEFDSLYKVLGMLEREEVKHAPGFKSLTLDTDLHTPLNGFNMTNVRTSHECGTAGCLLGWARHIAGEFIFMAPKPAELDNLFCMGPPPDGKERGKSARDILPSEAAIALRSYLTHGEARWDEAVGSS